MTKNEELLHALDWAQRNLVEEPEQLHVAVGLVGDNFLLMRSFTYEPGMGNEMVFEGHEVVHRRCYGEDFDEDDMLGGDAPVMSGSYDELVAWVNSIPNRME